MRHIIRSIVLFIGLMCMDFCLYAMPTTWKDPLYPTQIAKRDTLDEIAGFIKVPAVTGPLTIDGKLNDACWKSARLLPLENAEIAGFGAGGEVRIALRGKYICLSAMIPDASPLVARSTGINPTWEREDLIAWRLKYQSPINRQTYFVTLAINPLGAVSLFAGDSHYYESVGDDVINSRKRLIGIHGAVAVPQDDFVNATGSTVDWVNDILSAAVIADNQWTAEIALPLERFGPIGFMSIERVKAARPTTPELSWYWPAPNVRGYYELPESNMEAAPVHQPPSLPQNPVEEKKSVPGNALAKEVAALPKQAWTKEEQKSLGVSSMLEKSIRARMAESAEDEKRDWQKVRNVEDWENFRDTRLAALREWLGPMPERTPLRSTVTRKSNFGDGFVIENLVFESRPHLPVTANLYLPEKISEKMPAVIVIHAHHAPKTQIELQDMGMTWARAGTAVLIMDQINAGERSQSQPWARESYHGRYATGNQLYLAGESLIKWMAWDIIRSVDVLLERPYIDPDRIVLLGGVAGGGDPAALTANLDPRIAAVIPFCFGEASPEAHYLEGPRKYNDETADPGWGYWETTRNLPHSVSEQFFPWFLCTAGAPRPFIFAFELAWPKIVEEEPIWARYKKVYEFYGARDHLDEVDGLGPFPGPGETNQISTYLRQSIDPILHRWFKIPVPQTEYHKMLRESELMCLTPATALKFKPKPVASLVKELAVGRLKESRSKRAHLTAEQSEQVLREELAKKLGDIEPENNPSIDALWSRPYAEYVMEASSVETEEGIRIPVFLLIPKNNSNRRPAVIALAEGGKEGFLSERHNEIATLLSKGITVCLPDVRGTGELDKSNTRAPRAMGLAANELMLGGTMTGARLKDTRTIFRWLAKRSDIDRKKIAVWGDSFSRPNAPDFSFHQSPGQPSGPIEQRQAEPLGSVLAILTALYEDDVTAVACSGGLISFLSVLDDRFCHIPQDVIVPGILEVTDLGEIVSSISPRPVLLEKMVDGQNKKVSVGTLEKEYGARTSRVMLPEKTGKTSLAVWLSKQL